MLCEPTGALEIANRIAAKVASGRIRAQAAGRLQNVLKAHRDVPPIEDQCGLGHDLALKLPEPGIAIGQHRRWRSGADPAVTSASANSFAESPLRAKAKRCCDPSRLSTLQRPLRKCARAPMSARR